MPQTPHPLSDKAAAALLDDMLDPLDNGAEKAGDVIGFYRLIEKIGEGGFGIVWRAEQTHPVRRDVALKLLKRGMDSRQILARFEQERRLLAAMEHPSIATMLDAGVSRDGRPYFVMEMLRGLPLTKYCEDHGLPVRRKIALFRDVCVGVQHAHQKGVIHRDLKPSNIIVTDVDGRAVPKIIDFGIAKAMDSGGLQANTLLTQANFVLGTPQYMSPEQLVDGSNVDTRSDIYALGALLYELLAGTPPFDPRTITEKGAPEFRRLIRETRPKRPSTALTTRQFVSSPQTMRGVPDASPLPADLDWITLRALEKEPQRRYQSAAEFAADLQRFLDNEPVLAHPPSAAYIASRWIRRHRVIFAAACFSVVALVGGAGVALWQAGVAREAQRRAEAESLRSRETADFLTSLLSEVALEVQKGRNPEALRLALISSQARIEAMTRDSDLQIALTSQVAELFEGMSDRRLAAEALRMRAERMAARLGKTHPDARAAALKHIHMVVDHGNRMEAVQMLNRLRADIEENEGRGSPPWFATQRVLVRAWTKLRNGKEAMAASALAVEEARRVQMPPHEMQEILLLHVDSLQTARQFDQAIAVVEEVRALDPGAHQDSVDTELVDIEVTRGAFARAADMQKAVVDKKRGDKNVPVERYLRNLRWLAEIEIKARRYADAILHVDEAVAVITQLINTTPEDGGNATTLRDDKVKLLDVRIEAFLQQKRPAEALATAEESLRIARQGGNHSTLSRALRSLAGVHEAAGRLDEAWQCHQQLYQLHTDHNASLRNSLENLREMVRIRQKQGRPQDALGHAREAWRLAVAEPSAHLDPEYLAYMADLGLKSWAVLHAADPTAVEPAELPLWQEASRNDPTKKK